MALRAGGSSRFPWAVVSRRGTVRGNHPPYELYELNEAPIHELSAGRWTRLLTQHLASDSPEHDLETVLSAVASDYSAIICDTRPEVDNQLLLQALATARFVVIPFKKDKNDKASVRRYKAVVDRLKKNANPQLEILGSVLFLWRRGKPGLDAYLKERENESGSDRSGVSCARQVTPARTSPIAVY